MANNKSEYHELKGSDKAAMLLLAVGEDNAIKLFQHMQNEEIRDLSTNMSSLGKIEADIIEDLFAEFVESLMSTGSVIGSYDSTERLLKKALDPERAAMIMDDIRGPAGRTMWDKLTNVSESVLANYLKNEYPQTVAVVLSKISPEHASKVLELLPENMSMEVIMRMLRMETVKKEILDSVEKTLRTEFMTNLARTSQADSHEGMAEIFNNFDRATEGRFMNMLEERNRESADRIKALMFTFEDLNNLDGPSMQILLRSVEAEVLALALKGAGEEMRQLVRDNMSKRAGRILMEDMDAMGPVRLRDVDEAQAKMVSVAKDLASRGEIVLADGGAEEQLVY
ncbi:MAG: flagellar motor switch protein FliG [Alphaproteobacteria bacterium]